MSNWQEPEVIWRSDRSWKEKGEEVRLERGEYQGHSTYKLRLMWRTDDGSWRWSQARETSSGKTWAEFGLKQRELESLGKLLLAEAKSPQPAIDVSTPLAAGPVTSSRMPSGQPRRAPTAREQAELDKFDAECGDIPF